jgi:hypothetical protein
VRAGERSEPVRTQASEGHAQMIDNQAITHKKSRKKINFAAL